MPLRPRENAWSQPAQSWRRPAIHLLRHAGDEAQPGIAARVGPHARSRFVGRIDRRFRRRRRRMACRTGGRRGLCARCAAWAFSRSTVLPDVLGSADVLVAILEADAGVFSVPSKVLSYFCAGRPVLLAVPRENLAAKIVVESGAGLVVEPSDVAGFCRAAQQLIDRRNCARRVRPRRPPLRRNALRYPPHRRSVRSDLYGGELLQVEVAFAG